MTLSMKLRAALAMCVLAAPAVLHAQDYTKYDTVNNPKRYGTIWAPFYQKANELTAQTRKDFPQHLDIPFGESPKQALDVYLPKKPVKNAPVLLFLHGGGFMEGDRAHYGYVARPYVEKGIVTVVSGYRMAKRGVPYPAQSDDTKAAIVWIHKNIAKFGGDPNRIFLSGHSVGATLSADVSFDRGWMKQAGVPRDAIKGIALISGDYDLSPGENADYAPTAELEERASPDRHLVDPAPVAVVAAGTNEGKMRASAEDIEQRLIAKGVKGNLLILEGADHKDTVLAFGEPGSTLSAAVLEMIGRK
ncbi:MAG TPA: alpha/beta hydrolase [Steroidobacteraceae bacterium]|nr:alpha/beta hydrolase [Steroidobacteraceae bacterium]